MTPLAYPKITCLQIVGHVDDPLRVQELADDVRGLQIADGLFVLDDGLIKIALAIQVVGVMADDVDHALLVILTRLRQIDRDLIRVLLEKDVQLGLGVLLAQLPELFALFGQHVHRAPLADHAHQVGEGLGKADVSVLDVVDADRGRVDVR